MKLNVTDYCNIRQCNMISWSRTLLNKVKLVLAYTLKLWSVCSICILDMSCTAPTYLLHHWKWEYEPMRSDWTMLLQTVQKSLPRYFLRNLTGFPAEIRICKFCNDVLIFAYLLRSCLRDNPNPPSTWGEPASLYLFLALSIDSSLSNCKQPC